MGGGGLSNNEMEESVTYFEWVLCHTEKGRGSVYIKKIYCVYLNYPISQCCRQTNTF